jgi:hypothetical protein
MATLEISIPIEVVEAEVKNIYGLDYGVEVLDVVLDEASGDLVMLVYVDDEEFAEISLFNEVKDSGLTDTWGITTTADFIEGIL